MLHNEVFLSGGQHRQSVPLAAQLIELSNSLTRRSEDEVSTAGYVG
jgi:hypothetical protein